MNFTTPNQIDSDHHLGILTRYVHYIDVYYDNDLDFSDHLLYCIQLITEVLTL